MSWHCESKVFQTFDGYYVTCGLLIILGLVTLMLIQGHTCVRNMNRKLRPFFFFIHAQCNVNVSDCIKKVMHGTLYIYITRVCI